jgi:hypothetical protein
MHLPRTYVMLALIGRMCRMDSNIPNLQHTPIYARLTIATLDAQARKVCVASHRVVGVPRV